MSSVTALDAFPRRPIAVRAGRHTIFTAAGYTLTALIVLIGASWFAGLYGPGLLRDARVWRDGRSAPVTDIAGSCLLRLSLIPISWCSLDVSYRAADGSVATRSVTALTFGAFDQSEPPSIKIDPHDEAIALSWFADDLVSRWVGLAIASGGLTFLAGVLGTAVWASLREFWLYRTLARAPNPIEARVIGVRIVSTPSWAREISFSFRAADGKEHRETQRLRFLKGQRGVAPQNWTYEEPLPLSTGGDVLLALAGRRRARLVKSSFEPLLLTDAERQRLRPVAT